MDTYSSARIGIIAGADGTQNLLRGGKSGELVTGQAHGSYMESVYRQQVFSATNQAATAVSIALATTYTGICLSNPIGNSKLLVVSHAGFAVSSAPAGIASIHLIGGSSAVTNVTHTTPLIPLSNNLGSGATPTAKIDGAATIPTPVYLQPLMNANTSAALPTSTGVIWAELKGVWILQPGGFICIGALTAVTGFGGFIWEEIPL